MFDNADAKASLYTEKWSGHTMLYRVYIYGLYTAGNPAGFGKEDSRVVHLLELKCEKPPKFLTS